MKQYDVIDNPVGSMRAFVPYLVSLQSHYLQDIESVVVAPVILDGLRPLTSLDVPVTFDNRTMVVAVAEMSSMFRPAASHKRGSLVEHQDGIRRALEKLFTGF